MKWVSKWQFILPVSLLLMLGIALPLFPRNFITCNIRNTTTVPGEKLKYKVYYTWAGIYVPAGEAVFSNKLERYMNRPVYHVTGFGQTYKSYDWFYKVYDTYESFIDTATMLPLKFQRNVHEGNHRFSSQILFDHQNNKANSGNKSISTPDCVHDVLSAIYFARNMDFTKCKAGDKINFNMILDHEVYPLYIRYVGKEKFSSKYGSYNTIKFKPKLIEGTLFKGGEEMTVYVTDDQYKIPVYIETPIIVGKIKVYYIK